MAGKRPVCNRFQNQFGFRGKMSTKHGKTLVFVLRPRERVMDTSLIMKPCNLIQHSFLKATSFIPKCQNGPSPEFGTESTRGERLDTDIVMLYHGLI